MLRIYGGIDGEHGWRPIRRDECHC